MRCGICHRSSDWDFGWLPLISLSAHATICESSSRLILKQSFGNPTNEAVPEAEYHFPIYEGAAIVAFTCTIDERIIQGAVREKQTARKLYDTAKERGQKAALFTNPRPDLWTTKISNIPANGNVEVEITVVCELKHDAQVDGIRFVLPTHIAERYGTQPENLPPGISSESRGIDMMIAVTMASPIVSLQSPSHPVEVGMGTHSPNKSLSKDGLDFNKGFVTLSQKDTALDKDFVLIVKSAGIGQPQAIVETHPSLANSRVLMLSLVPKFRMPRIRPEIVFVADRSGSMEDNIPQLKNALKVFLKSLPVGVKFNICSFGSEHTFLWPKSVAYDQDNLDTALKHVETFAADYGGTEMFPPVEQALKNRYRDLETEIIVLTDGEIWDTQPLFDLVRAECESKQVRVFSLGIGESVSHNLVEGLARAGRGYAQIVGNDDKLDAKVVRMLKASLGAHVKDYQFVFPDSSLVNEQKHDEEGFELVERPAGSESAQSGLDGDAHGQMKPSISLYDTAAADKSPGGEVTEASVSSHDRFSHLPPFEPPTRLQTPHRIPPLYPFSRTNIFIFLSGSEATPSAVTLTGTTTSGENLVLEVPVNDVGEGTTLHQLAAKKLLQELDEGGSYLHSGKFGVDRKDEGKSMDWIEREGIRVGTTFGVAGKWTSFVAVENIDELEHQMEQELSTDMSDYLVQPCSLVTGSVKLLRCSVPAPGVYSSAALPQPSPYMLDAITVDAAQPVEDSQEMMAFRMDSSDEEGSNSAAYIEPEHMYTVGCYAEKVDYTEIKDESDVKKVDFSTYDGAGKTYALNSDDAEIENGSASHVKIVDDSTSDGASKTYALLGMQAFDGSFSLGSGQWASKLSETCNKWIQEEHEDRLATLRGLGEEELEKILASAVAIAIFQTELTDYEDVWEMVVEKTDSWGEGKVGETAWSALKSWVNQQVVMADDSEKQSFWRTKKQ